MNATLNAWINNMYRVGAIDVNGRDEFKERLNERREDFGTVVTDMNKYIRYLTPAYQKKWAALIAANFPNAAALLGVTSRSS